MAGRKRVRSLAALPGTTLVGLSGMAALLGDPQKRRTLTRLVESGDIPAEPVYGGSRRIISYVIRKRDFLRWLDEYAEDE